MTRLDGRISVILDVPPIYPADLGKTDMDMGHNQPMGIGGPPNKEYGMSIDGRPIPGMDSRPHDTVSSPLWALLNPVFVLPSNSNSQNSLESSNESPQMMGEPIGIT